jgi:hypothetical protein
MHTEKQWKVDVETNLDVDADIDIAAGIDVEIGIAAIDRNIWIDG